MNEQQDSLQSKAYAKIIDLVSEGEVEGLVDGWRSVYLDETPIQNVDGTYNFTGVSVESRTGSQAQDALSGGFDAIENEIIVNTEVKLATSVTRSITNPNITTARVKLSIPALTSTNTTSGDINGTTVQIRIERRSSGGGFVTVIDDTITGKTTTRYQKDYDIPLTGSAPWDIRVVRVTPDATSVTLQNKTYFDSYTERIETRLRYPNSALHGVRLDASEFSNIPRRAYDMKLRRVRVPSNYNANTRTYTGVWNGSFITAWTDNPAWCFYDLMTHTRYGLGGFIPEAQVDKWALYRAAQYCDQLVPNGSGGTEPRFTCNLYLQTREQAYKVMQDMASIFRAMVFWASGAVTVSQDAASDAVYQFTSANVIDGEFAYQGSSGKTRHTVALVSWNDPEDFYRQKVEYVEDTAGITRYGVVQTEVLALGCTSRGQAHRVGRWLLYSEQSESEIVTFRTGLEGAVVRPGNVIKVADPVRGGARLGGRVAAATTTSVTLDADFTPGTSVWRLSIITPAGSVEERAVASVSGRVITVASAYTTTPQVGAVWVLSATSVEAQLFRVVQVAETEAGIYEVTALAHNPDKYAAIEQNLTLQPRDITLLTAIPDAPGNVVVSESLYESSAEVRVNVNVSWDAVESATGYVVSYSVNDRNFINLPETAATDIDIRDGIPGIYRVVVRALNGIGRRSPPSSIVEREIYGKTLAPANVSGFSLVPIADMAFMSWDKATDLDVLVGGSVRIRYTPNITGQDWKNAVDIMPALAGSSTNAQAPLLAGTYMAKFVDSLGLASPTAAMIVTALPAGLTVNVVQTITESPAFAGAKTDTFVSEEVAGLVLTGSVMWDAQSGNVDDWQLIDSLGGVDPEGFYDFANTFDLGAVYTSRVSALIRAGGFDTTDLVDYRYSNIDDWIDVDGLSVDDVNAQLQMRTTNDNPSGTPTWTAWKPFFVADYQARAYQFRVRLTSASPTHNIVVEELSVTIDMPDRVESQNALTSGAASYHVSYPNSFKAVPTLGITASNMATGDYFTVTNEATDGFDIVFKNAAGTAVSRTFGYLARGYGRRI